MKTLLISIGALALSASTAFAACTAPSGKYAGATAGISYDASTKQPKNFQNRQFFVQFKDSDGSGSVQIILTPSSGQSVTANFPARGTNGHTWNSSTCSGKITASALGQTVTLAYVVVSSGNKVLLNDATSGSQSEVYPYVITIEKQ